MTPPSPPDLSALLERSPADVAVERGLDHATVRLQRLSALQRGWASAAGWWAARGARIGPDLLPLGVFLALNLVLGAALTVGVPLLLKSLLLALTTAFLAAFCVALIAMFLWIPTWMLSAVLAARRACRVLLTAQRITIEELGFSAAFELESVEAVIARPPGEEPARQKGPSELEIQTRRGHHVLLRGVQAAELRWLAQLLEAAVQQRKTGLLAAGHDPSSLDQAPQEAALLRTVAARAGDPTAR